MKKPSPASVARKRHPGSNQPARKLSQPSRKIPAAGDLLADLRDFLGGDTRNAVAQIRSLLYKVVPVAAGKKVAQLQFNGGYREMAAALRDRRQGLQAPGMAFLFVKALKSVGIEAWTYSFGVPNEFEYYATLAREGDRLTLHDAFLNWSIDADIRDVLRQYRHGGSVPYVLDARHDKPCLLSDEPADVEYDTWIVNHARLQSKPSALRHVPALAALERYEAMAAHVCTKVLGRSPPAGLLSLIDRPISVLTPDYEYVTDLSKVAFLDEWRMWQAPGASVELETAGGQRPDEAGSEEAERRFEPVWLVASDEQGASDVGEEHAEAGDAELEEDFDAPHDGAEIPAGDVAPDAPVQTYVFEVAELISAELEYQTQELENYKSLLADTRADFARMSEEASSKIASFRSQVAELTAQLAEAREEALRARALGAAREHDLRVKVENQSRELDVQKNLLANTNAEILRVRDEVHGATASYRAELAEAAAQIEKLQADAVLERSAQDAREAVLTSEVERLSRELEAQKRSRLQAETELVQAQDADPSAPYRLQLAEVAAELDQALAEGMRRQQAAAQREAELQTEIRRLTGELGDLKRIVAAASEDSTRSSAEGRSAVAEAHARLNEAFAQIDSLRAEAGKAQTVEERLRAEIARMSEELEAGKALVTGATADVINTRNEALNAQATLKARLNEATVQIERLRAEAAQAKSHDQFLRAEGVRLSNELENHKSFLAKANTELHQLRSDASHADGELLTRLHETTAQLELARASALHAKAQETQREEQIQRDLARLLEEVEANSKLAAEASEETIRLRAQTAAREQELRTEFVRIAAERETNRKALEDAGNQVARMQAELLHAKSQLAERGEHAQAEIAQLTRERDAARTDLTGLRAEILRVREDAAKAIAADRALLADIASELDQTRAEAVWAGERAAERQDHLRALLIAAPHFASVESEPERAGLSILQAEMDALRQTLAAVRTIRDDTELELRALEEPVRDDGGG